MKNEIKMEGDALNGSPVDRDWNFYPRSLSQEFDGKINFCRLVLSIYPEVVLLGNRS